MIKNYQALELSEKEYLRKQELDTKGKCRILEAMYTIETGIQLTDTIECLDECYTNSKSIGKDGHRQSGSANESEP